MPRPEARAARLLIRFFILLLVALTGTTALLAQENTAVPAAAEAASEAPPVERFFAWRQWTENYGFSLNNCQIIAAGDINGDGLEDLICPYNYGGNGTRTFVQLTDGLGLSGWISQREAFQVQIDLNNCRPLLSGDLSGDGLTDLVCVYNYGDDKSRTYVQLNGGNDEEPFRSWTSLQEEFGPDLCKPVLVGDVNGDGLDDVICPRDDGGAVTHAVIQFSDGDSLRGWVHIAGTTVSQFDLERCAVMLSGDVNNDGEIDLICPYNYGGSQTRTFVELSAGAGGIEFASWSDLNSQFNIDACRLLAAGDINGDGMDDVACVYDYGGSTRTFVQLSGGADLTAWEGDTSTPGFDVDSCTFSKGDLNADGRMDLFCNYDYGFGNTATFVQMARENSYSIWQVATAASGPRRLAMGSCVKGIFPGDYNGDGHTDLACPYDYGSGLNRTFVQLAALHRQFLPSLIGE